MSSVLDMITGGGLLPYVYCKKIALERGEAEGTTDITLQLEIYQDKNALGESTWLNNLEGLGNNLMDSLHIQVMPLREKQHVLRLLASHEPTQNPGNIYVAKRYLGDGYLPRGKRFHGAFQTVNEAADLFPGGIEDLGLYETNPIKLSVGSLLGDLTQDGKLAGAREITKSGKSYIVIPYEYKYTGVEITDSGDLGFLFYTFLDVPHYLSYSEIVSDLAEEITEIIEDEEFLIEGPVNSTVVFRNGKVEEQREVFVQPNGEVWEGSVHLHTVDNPAPGNYYGDGSFGDNKGWMVGEMHKPGANQPKLSLIRAPNNLISDFRFGLFPEPADTALGLGTETKVFNLGQDVAYVEEFLSPFQKEKRKDLIKDNDSEYSKLYICRDKDNNARGMFFINFLEMLKNNSSLFPILFSKYANHIDDINNINNILAKSRLLELKLYRDRVKKRVINTRYEKYANDEIYEEPSQLVATISDLEGYQTPNQNSSLSELTGLKGMMSVDTWTRYFMFHDLDVGDKVAGLYRYRVELDFKDGTYEFLYELLRIISQIKFRLDSYHEVSLSSYVDGTVTRNFANEYVSKKNEYVSSAYNKNVIKHYFQNESFVDAFHAKAESMFPDKPWNMAATALNDVQRIFGIYPSDPAKDKVDFDSIKYMMSPAPGDAGSPQGINFFSRLLDVAIKKMQSILGATKVNKSGSEISANSVPDGYTFNNFFDVVVSPSDCIISEDHTFDHPSELFKALANEDIYIDYLSIGETKDSNFEGLRSLSPEYYIDRCKLDTVKFSPKAGLLDNGVNGWVDYPFSVLGENAIPDSFDNTGYSYLTPSIIELSDPTVDNDSFEFLYTAFNTGARFHLTNTDSPLYADNFNDLPNYDRLFISLLNYSINKQNNDDADLTGANNYKISDPGNIFAGIMDDMETRQAYKNLFDEISLTVHDSQYHGSFFDRQPGALSVDISDKEELENWHPSNYSDGTLPTHKYFKRALLSTKQNLIKSPVINPGPYGYDTNLPNPFKLRTVRLSRALAGNEEILQPAFIDAFNVAPVAADQSYSGDYEAFFFFNLSLTSKIEVFGPPAMGNHFSKDDENRWSPLKNSHLGLTDDEKLFCRISFYDESLVQGMNLPILDRYFLIYKNGDNPFVPPVIPVQPTDVGESPLENPSFWESQNQNSLNNFINMTEKGVTTDGPPDVLPPYQDIYGGDPDPSASPEAPPGTGVPTDDVPAGPDNSGFGVSVPSAGGGTNPFATPGANTFQGTPGPSTGGGGTGY